jgi:capping protein alpha
MAEEYDIEAATPEEKLRIAQHFLLSSPPGQINDVLGDVRKLLPEGFLTPQQINDIFRAYNIDTMKIVEVGDHKISISKASEIDGSHYIDPIGNKVVGYNHTTQALSGEERPLAGEMDANMEEPRAALQKAVSDYASSQFGAKTVAGCCFAREGKLTVTISAEKLSLRNFWSGSWRSQFEIVFTGGTQATMTGTAKIHIHYFEDGNVQMQNEKPCNVTVDFTDATSLAAAVIQKITEHENMIQGSLEEMYSNMSGETFKDMRRVMPVTRNKFDWNVNAHKMVRNLRK